MNRQLLKVGDKVRLTNDDVTPIKVGTICTVEKIEPPAYDGAYTVKIEDADRKISDWVMETQIELVDPDEVGEFIIWSPNSTKAPERAFTAKQARFVARKMAQTRGGVFYVAKLTHKYTGVPTVVKEVL